MHKKSRWIAAGLAAAMCATATLGAVSLAEEQSEPVEAVAEEAPAETEAPEEEAAETEAQAVEAAETEASDEEEATEAETETETETEKASKKKKKKKKKNKEKEEAQAETEVEYVSVSFDNEDVWNELTIPNSELVETAVNIRSGADEDSEVIGYLYNDAAAWIIEDDGEWTEIYSNGLTGYVLSEYMLTGDEVAGVADAYGIEGVRAEWDGVVVFATDEAVDELSVMNAGDVYPVVSYGDHWDEIQYDEDTVAYVSNEDVVNVLIFAPATPKDGERTELGEVYEVDEEDTEEYYEEDYTEDVYYEEYDEDSYEDDYYEDDYYEDSYDDSYYYDDSSYYYEEPSYSDTYYEPTYTEPTYTAPTYTYSGSSSSGYSSGSSSSSSSSSSSYSGSTSQTQAATEAAEVGTTNSSANNGGAYYDANTDTYYDDDGNAVSTYSYYYTDDDYTTYSSDNYAEVPYWEETYEEEVSYGSTAGSDDTSLLAALIYCEACGQPYDGMVAVGAVVMNRVYSGSFPNSISEVIYQSGQFTPASSGALSSALASGVGDTYYAAASDALAGVDPTGGALYFNTSHGSGVQIGDHWFY